MKIIKLTFLLIILTTNYLLSQNLKPTETKALLNFLVTDIDGFPRNHETIIAKSIPDGNTYTCVSDENGRCSILVPKGKNYKIQYYDLIEKTNYSDFEVPNKFGLMSFNIRIKFSQSKMLEAKGVNFKEKTAALTLKATEKLDSIAEIIKHKKIKLEIAAHTDNSLPENDAIELTKQRAEKVKEYLVSKGVKKEKLYCKAYGSSEPIADNNTTKGKLKNNRIEFRIKHLTNINY